MDDRKNAALVLASGGSRGLAHIGAIEVLEERGERAYTEKRAYDAVEKIALLKDRIYLFLGAGLAYYIMYTDMTEGDFGSLCEFLRSKVNPAAFRMKDSRRRNKQFPYGR